MGWWFVWIWPIFIVVLLIGTTIYAVRPTTKRPHPLVWLAHRRYMNHPTIKELRQPLVIAAPFPSYKRQIAYICPSCGNELTYRRYSISKEYPRWSDVRCEKCGFEHNIDHTQSVTTGPMRAYGLDYYTQSVWGHAETRLMEDWEKRFDEGGGALPEIRLPHNYWRDRTRRHA